MENEGNKWETAQEKEPHLLHEPRTISTAPRV